MLGEGCSDSKLVSSSRAPENRSVLLEYQVNEDVVWHNIYVEGSVNRGNFLKSSSHFINVNVGIVFAICKGKDRNNLDGGC